MEKQTYILPDVHGKTKYSTFNGLTLEKQARQEQIIDEFLCV